MTAPASAGVRAGRFAPSPTGPLHAGSLLAALASYLDARSRGGRWLLRIEDLDPPRETPQAARDILDCLERLSLLWDGEVLYQSRRHEAYRAALARLQQLGLVYACGCSRLDLQDMGGVYDGRCGRLERPPEGRVALRCRVPSEVPPAPLRFDDLIQGPQEQDLARQTGDFVIRRKDGFHAYQLAVVVDDAFQGITHVIRGIDLLDSTPRQIYLQQVLALPTPVYGHIPVLVNDRGQKLSKQHFAPALDLRRPQRLLLDALAALRQASGAELAHLEGCSCEEILLWATPRWNFHHLRGLRVIRSLEMGR